MSIDTLRKCRAAVKAWQDKVASTYAQGTRNRDEADNYLKALYGLTKMLETPAVDEFLEGLGKYETTPLRPAATFMRPTTDASAQPSRPCRRLPTTSLVPCVEARDDSA